MANVFNEYGRVWECATDDILTFNTQTDADSGLKPITIRKIVYRPGTTAYGVIFETLNISSTPTLTLTADTFSVTNTNRVSDDAGTALDDTNCVIGHWLHITKSSTGNNLGWWYISAVDGSHVYVDVQIVGQSARIMTNDTSAIYTLSVYNPETCMVLTSMTSSSDAEIKSEILDWGDCGRHFDNLSMRAIGGGTAEIYLL